MQTAKWIMDSLPFIAVLGGPPLYLLGYRLQKNHLAQIVQNLSMILDTLPKVILDHHLLRDLTWRQWRDDTFIATPHSQPFLCVAEFLGEPILQLEACREELYQENPPSKEFIRWTRNKEINRLNPPPLE